MEQRKAGGGERQRDGLELEWEVGVREITRILVVFLFWLDRGWEI